MSGLHFFLSLSLSPSLSLSLSLSPSLSRYPSPSLFFVLCLASLAVLFDCVLIVF
jgi:hypothetical protein